MHYLYDETFEGFLTCVHHHYHGEKADGIFPASRYQTNLIVACSQADTDEEKARAVCDAVARRISARDLERIYRVFRSSAEDKEMKLLRYIRLGFKYGAQIRLMHAHPCVLDVQAAEQRVGNEIQKLCGLIRFSVTRPAAAYVRDHEFDATEIDGIDAARGADRVSPDENGTALSANMPAPREILYAVIEPDNDLTEFLADHFCDRFKNDPFIIHDKKREKALVAFNREWYVTDFSNDGLLRCTEEEEEYRGLWRQYFDIMAIKERTNPRCQRNFMPLRYWKHITEVNRTPRMTGV
jgi:hypothetical protein